MKALFTLLISILSFAATAQVPEPAMLWLRGFGGNSEVATNVSPQSDGGFILCIGATTNVGNIDSFCSISGDRNIFMKFNPDASILEWSKCYFDNFDDSGFAYMFSTPDGGYVLGGISNDASHALLIHKEDATGTILWSKVYGDSSEVLLESMMATQDGGYIMVGEVYYTNSDFPIHYGSWADEDIAVIKVDSNGNKVWSEVIGGSSIDLPVSVIPAPGNGCYIAGTTLSNDHDCTGNHGGDDVYLVRLDKNGNIVWHNDIGGSGGDQGNYAATDGQGGVVIAGASNSPDGDRTHFPVYGCPVWALQVDSNSNVLWNNCYGGGGSNCYPNAICKAADGSIWIAAVSTLTGGQVDTQYGHDDAWVLHVSDTGDIINAKVLGSSLDDRGMMIYPLSNSNVIAGGYFSWGDDVFDSLFSGTYGVSTNAFLTVFAPSPTGIAQMTEQNNNLEIYPNPANDLVTIIAEKKGNSNLVIADIIGSVIYRTTFNDNIQIQVKGWQRGVYYVQVIGENGFKTTKKLLVE